MVIGKPQSDPTLEWFLSHCHIHKYPAKSTLIHAGEKAETLYYIVKGTVAVLIKDDEGKEMILSYLNQGDFLGEMVLARQTVRKLTQECAMRLIDQTKLVTALMGKKGVKEVRGQGLMIGVELAKPCGVLVQRAADAGLLISVTADSVVRIVPPLILTTTEADAIVALLTPLVKAFLAE